MGDQDDLLLGGVHEVLLELLVECSRSVLRDVEELQKSETQWVSSRPRAQSNVSTHVSLDDALDQVKQESGRLVVDTCDGSLEAAKRKSRSQDLCKSPVAREDAQQTHASDRKLTDVWISPVQMPLIYSHASSSFFSPFSSIFESTTRSPWR